MPGENQPVETEEQDVIDLEDGGEEETSQATAEPAAKPGERPSKVRRRNHYREAQEEALRARAEAQRERELRLQSDQMRMAAEQRAMQSQQQGGGGDPIDQALEENFRARQGLDEEFQLKQGKLSKEDIANMQRKAQWLEDQRSMLNTEKVNRSRPQQNPQIAALETYAAANHPEVVNDQNAKFYFQGELVRRKAQADAMGRQFDLASAMKDSLEQTERDLKIGKYRNGRGIDPGLESRLSGHTRGAGSASSNGGIQTNEIRMTDRLKAMAEQAFPELVQKGGARAAHEKWAKTVGKRLVSQGKNPSDA